jgi:hypothetical protein
MSAVIHECHVGDLVEIDLFALNPDQTPAAGAFAGSAAASSPAGPVINPVINPDGTFNFSPDQPGDWRVAVRLVTPVQASVDAYVRVNPLILEP